MAGSRIVEDEIRVVKYIVRTFDQPGNEGADLLTLSEQSQRIADDSKSHSILVVIKTHGG